LPLLETPPRGTRVEGIPLDARNRIRAAIRFGKTRISWDACSGKGNSFVAREPGLKIRVAIWVMLYGLGMAGLLAAAQAPAPEAPVQVIDIQGQKYKYTPFVVHVKKGARVELHLHAEDHAHGLAINLYPDDGGQKGVPGLIFERAQKCWRAEKGQVVAIDFVAQQQGSYAFKCCVFCGLGHLGMHGQLIVDP
jgi:heme/copper-type cytochrome/quinol oxidase subunit 2